MLLAYLKRQYKLLLLLAGAVCIFAAVFALYDLPLEAVLYAGALCLALGLVLFAVGYSRFLRRHRELQRLLRQAGEKALSLPPARGLLEEDYQTLLQAVCRDRARLAAENESRLRELTDYYIDLTTGLRRGELLGLKWSDIDLEKGDLRVQRQIGRIDGKIIEMPLKTKNAYRTLPLSADAIDVLMQQRRKTGNSEWVFPSPTGGPMSPDSVLHMLHRVLKRAGLPKVRFHDLRHTFATLALQNGVDIKTVSGMLGHFSAGFTLDTYAHVTTSAKREAAKTMGNLLSGAV